VRAQNFSAIDFPGSVQTEAQGVNDQGQVVGFYNASNGFLGFIWKHGSFDTIVVPGSFPFSTSPSGINNLGQVVGSYNGLSDFAEHGFLLTGSVITTIDCPGATGTLAFGINDLGQIVGSCSYPTACTSCNPFVPAGTHGFVSNGGSFSLFDFPGARQTSATGINNSGQIVGYYVGSDQADHGFFLIGGIFTGVDFPGGNNTHPTGINNAGQIVGAFSRRGVTPGDHGFLISGGNFNQIDVPEATLTQAFGINNGGQVVGLYVDGVTRLIHGFLRDVTVLSDPVPDLLSGGTGVTSDSNLLATKGQIVQGVAADGVTQAVLRITAGNVGDQFILALLNDQTPSVQSNLPDEDGALGNPGDTTFFRSTVTETAQATSAGPMAFAVYRAPVDFARLSGSVSGAYKSGSCSGVTRQTISWHAGQFRSRFKAPAEPTHRSR
jgi:uncharacterized membrane protein